MNAEGGFLSSAGPLAIPFKTNAGIVLWSVTNATLGAYAAFSLLTRLKPQGVHSLHRALVLILAALSLSFGSWACQLVSSRLRLVRASDSGASLFISFEPGFVALSICVPVLLIIGAFVVLDLRCSQAHWNCGICGLAAGLSVGFMHYALYISLPSFDAVFSTTQILLSFFLCCSASIFSFLFMKICRRKWTQHVWIRILIPLLYGCAVSGADYLSLNGTSFIPSDPTVVEQTVGNRRIRDILTLVVPAIISLALGLLIVTLLTVEYALKSGCGRAFPPRLTIASIAFTSDGRVLVNEKGMLPTRIVNLEGLPKDSLDELCISRNTFAWLLSLSYDWTILSPYLARIMQNLSTPDKRLACIWRSLFSYLCPPFPPRSGLKVRLIEAITQLAGDLDVPLAMLGVLYDRTLETGTHIDIAEFLLLSENASLELHGVEEALKADSANAGRMLFLVRALPHCPVYAHDYWPQKYAARGYKLKLMRRFRDTLSEATGAAQADVDQILLGCRDYIVTGTKSILESRGIYISLFSERWVDDDNKEVLVYDFARHQIPSYRLDLPELSPEMRFWLRDMAGISVADLIQVCKDDVKIGYRQGFRSSETSRFKSDIESCGQSSLLGFKDALARALEQLMRNLSFVGRDLPLWTRLTSIVNDVPSVSTDGPPAHMIVFHAQMPDDESDSELTHVSHSASFSSETSQSASSAPPEAMPMPSVFTYTPRRLFDAAQALACSSMADFQRETKLELDRLFVTAASARAECGGGGLGSRHSDRQRERHTHTNRNALVSSFSLDTLSDAGSEHTSRTRDAVERVRAGWASLKTRARALPMPQWQLRGLVTRRNIGARRSLNSESTYVTEPVPAAFYQRTRSTLEINSSAIGVPGSVMHRDRISPSQPGRSDLAGGYSGTMLLPPAPFVLPNHPFGRSGLKGAHRGSMRSETSTGN
ncbi:hypothetical protein DFH11DRAFT_1503199 [Phellopilus nigrolimitatus]|nr:hypothetical protein DFH11DRAFT_1503199 [Phellopilus nigrolimitatus]